MKRRQFVKTTSTALAGLSLGSTFLSCGPKKYDYAFFGASLIDGSGKEAVLADVAVKGGKIVKIGSVSLADAAIIIDAQGKVLCPGFIDIHTHSDTCLFVNPHSESKITQGVTTEVIGMDGDSAAPLTEEMRQKWEKRTRERYGYAIPWNTVEGYFQALQQNRHAVNIATFIGQGTLRENVIGMSDRSATPEEIKQMQALLEKAMAEGAYGISSGLEYTPGSFAPTEEIIAVASVLKGTRFPYTTHMRNEADTLLEAVDEAIRISRGAGIPLHISHLKVEGQRNWHKTDQLFALLEKAKNEGLQITFDRYTYVAYHTGLANVFPLWAREGGDEKFVERLRDKKLLKEMKKTSDDKINMMGSWHNFQISGVKNEAYKFVQGKRMDEIAGEMGLSPFEAAVKLLIENENQVGVVGFGMSEENTERILAHPDGVVASDGSGLAISGPLAEGSPHPRSFGTFTRALGYYVRERKILELPQMIHKLSGKPAAILGLNNRGTVREGNYADLVVFDPGKIQDKSTFENPFQYSEGIDQVFVNGQPVVTGGKITPNLPGHILKSV